MRKILNILFSPRTTLGLLVIFAIAMGAATFIENSYDTITAKILIYNATWFEALMVLMVVNFIGSIQRYHLLTWKKIPGFIFHFSFIIMIIGAGVTRYIGFEGRMHIREGQQSNYILGTDNIDWIEVDPNGIFASSPESWTTLSFGSGSAVNLGNFKLNTNGISVSKRFGLAVYVPGSSSLSGLGLSIFPSL